MPDVPEKPPEEEVAKVTKALADAGVLFSLGEAGGIKNWRVTFALDQGEKIIVQLGIQRTWLIIFHIEEASKPLETDELRAMLRLNVGILLAKIGMTDDGRVAVMAQIPLNTLTPDSLRVGLNSVVAGVVLVRRPELRPKEN